MYGAVYDTVSADALAESATEATLTARYNAAANDLNEFKRRREVVAPHAASIRLILLTAVVLGPGRV